MADQRKPAVSRRKPLPRLSNILAEPDFPDAETRYRYERSNIECSFQQNWAIWESVYLKNPPHVTIGSEGPGWVETQERDDCAMVNTLSSHVGPFLCQTLLAYADLLLEQCVPAHDALRRFEEHADELQREAYEHKWIPCLRRIDLSLTDFEERFKLQSRIARESARRDFEELLWKVERDATTPEDYEIPLPVGLWGRAIERTAPREVLSETPKLPNDKIGEKNAVEVPLQMSKPSDTVRGSMTETPSDDGLTPIFSLSGNTNAMSEHRRAVIVPLQIKKGWSILDWALKSEVDYHTANDYLKGVTKPYRSTRKKLAESLGLKPEELPD